MIDKIFKKVEIVKFIITALKSIPKLVKLQSLPAKCGKMWKYKPVKFANFLYLNYQRKIDTFFLRAVAISRA